MFDYSKIFLPVQALNQQVIESVLSIENLYKSMSIDVNTNDLSNEILFEEERDRIRNVAEIREVDEKYQINFLFDFWSIYVVCRLVS